MRNIFNGDFKSRSLAFIANCLSKDLSDMSCIKEYQFLLPIEVIIINPVMLIIIVTRTKTLVPSVSLTFVVGTRRFMCIGGELVIFFKWVEFDCSRWVFRFPRG